MGANRITQFWKLGESWLSLLRIKLKLWPKPLSKFMVQVI